MRKKDIEKENAIYNAAIEIISRLGFENASMSKIAKKANVSPSTIYVYFDNKEDMLNKVYLKAKQKSSEFVLSFITDNCGVEQGTRAFLKNLFTYALNNPVEYLFTEHFSNSPNINKVSREQGMEFYKKAIDLIERGVNQGIIKDLNLDIILAFSIAPINKLVKAHHIGDLVLNENIIEKTIDIIIEIFKK